MNFKEKRSGPFKRGRSSRLFRPAANLAKPNIDLISKFTDFGKHGISPDGLYFVPLGGTGEFGLNLNAYYCDGKWLIVDIGVSFDGTSSINVFMPKIDFLKSIPREDIVAIVITHGHEDHLGGVQYLWRDLKRPVYTTKFTATLLNRKLKDMHMNYQSDLIAVEMRERIQLGPFNVQWIEATHSIPDTSMVLIRTRHGNILHTGDWRFDETPVIGEKSDIEMLQNFGKEGVLAVVGDSTNAMTEGKFSSEEDVKQSLEYIISRIRTGRVVVVCFSTNVSRVDSCARIGQRVNRKVALVGRSLHRIRDVSLENGYLKDVPEFITEDMAKTMNKDNLLIVCTGSQGEPHSGLRRLSDNEHPKITLEAGDTVIISARMITGKEKDINDMLNKLAKRGINIITTKQDADIHVSGHPPQEDLRTLYTMIRPKIGIPVHGEARNLIAHRDLFKSMGIQSELLDNGDFVELTTSGLKKRAVVEVGQVGLDGKKLIPRDGHVLMERAWLGASGFVNIIILMYSIEEFQFETHLCGVVEPYEHGFKNTLRGKIDTIIRGMREEDRLEEKRVITAVRNAVQSYIFLDRGIDPRVYVNVFVINHQKSRFIEELVSEDQSLD
jgi:ribonuclease J